jgi:hypothetical protein
LVSNTVEKIFSKSEKLAALGAASVFYYKSFMASRFGEMPPKYFWRLYWIGFAVLELQDKCCDKVLLGVASYLIFSLALTNSYQHHSEATENESAIILQTAPNFFKYCRFAQVVSCL